jgi:hypothetical protein
LIFSNQSQQHNKKIGISEIPGSTNTAGIGFGPIAANGRETVPTTAPRVVSPPRGNKPVVMIRLPRFNTIVAPISIGVPQITVNQSALIGAYTPHQQAITNLGQIDLNRLLPGRARRGGDKSGTKPGDTTPYTTIELRAFARQLGIPKSQNKRELVEAIAAKIKQHR